MNKLISKSNWWRKDAAVTHHFYGHGSITNFVACPKGAANVYFYKGDYVRQVWKYDLVKAGDDWKMDYND